MNISGITPWYFNNGQKRDYPQKRRENMREAFDRELDKYLERTSTDPFRECEGCGHNIFEYDEAYLVCGAYYCEDCVSKVRTVPALIEPTEWK